MSKAIASPKWNTISGIIGSQMIYSQDVSSLNRNSTFNISKRTFFSRAPKPTGDVQTDSSTTDLLSTDLLSAESEIAKFEEAANAADIVASTEAAEAIVAAADVWEPTWWPQDQMLNLIVNFHDVTGLNYALAIGGLTLAFRSAMFPLFVKAQANSSRMAHMRPEMDILKERVDKLDRTDMAGQEKMAKEMQKLFQKYEVNPLKSILVPIAQMPVFMSMFFALKQMPDIYPEKLADGGMFWFTDLNLADPTYILPATCGLSFLLMMEIGKEQMMSSSPQQGALMLNFFRFIALAMVPLTASFPTCVLCYWTANNTFSLFQAALFKNKGLKKAFGIWDAPKPVPGAPAPKGIQDMIKDYMDKKKKESGNDSALDRIKMHNAAVENKMIDKANKRGRTKRNKRNY
eukprot:CAMPEP_0194076672 /NCGR_PEP_ID=MMETSP0149-20130528/3441_1 /TAXON_ID=122233 /ORGANISM="Chaetoceros debilis, Strain MM31A-1" /LENGTH=402 /DNA_ID=CAMNT_0038757487 /DNA_START=203 /DNA_END=1412 /DNA_ORIENTATION=-